MTNRIKQLIPMLRYRLAHSSREGKLALLLLAVCGGFYMAAVQPAFDEREQLQDQLQSAQQKRQKAGKLLQSEESPAEQLAGFYKFFPSQDTVPAVLDKIYKAAAQQYLQLDRGNYQLAQDKSARLLRYRITLPAKGNYPQIRKFVANVISDIPNLSLDSISFERQKIGESHIDAKIKFTLYLDQPS